MTDEQPPAMSEVIDGVFRDLLSRLGPEVGVAAGPTSLVLCEGVTCCAILEFDEAKGTVGVGGGLACHVTIDLTRDGCYELLDEAIAAQGFELL